MNINIKATNIELTPVITEYVNKKIGSLDKYLNEKQKTAVFHIEVGKSTNHHKNGQIFKADLHVIGGGLDAYARSESYDLNAAIDLLEAEMATEIMRERGKASRMIRRGQRIMKDVMRGKVFGRYFKDLD